MVSGGDLRYDHYETNTEGELTDPLSQNRYTYVHNNPVNYTDPSGHFWKSIKKAASKAWNGSKKAASNAWNTVKRVATNTWNTVKSAVSHAVNWVSNKVSQAVNWIGTQVNHVKNWSVQQWNNYQSRTSYHASPSAVIVEDTTLQVAVMPMFSNNRLKLEPKPSNAVSKRLVTNTAKQQV